MAAKSDETKLADVTEKALGSFLFNHEYFAHMLCNRHILVQHGLFKVLSECINIWSTRFDKGAHETDDEFNLYARAARLRDAQIPFN